MVAGPNGVGSTFVARGVAGHNQRVVIDIRVGETGKGRLGDMDANLIAALRYGDDCRTI